MTATVFEKTWQFDMNRAYAPASALDLTRYQMWYLASVLTGNIGGLTGGSLWTLYASSNSVTAGTDSTDRWVLAGPYDGTKIVRGAASAAHSWIVLRSPTMNGLTFYMILSFNTSTDAAIRLSYSISAPISGTTTASPVTSPTTDKWSPNGFGTPVQDYTINAAATDNSRFSFGLASDGSFYLLCNKQGAGVANLSIMFHALSDYFSHDKAPVWTVAHYDATGANSYQKGAFLTSPNSGLYANIGCTVCNSLFIQPPICFGHSFNQLPRPTSVGIDGAWPDLPVIIIGSNGSSSTASISIKGRVADFGLTMHPTSGLAEGDTAPSGGPVDSCVAGGFWYPASAAFNFG